MGIDDPRFVPPPDYDLEAEGIHDEIYDEGVPGVDDQVRFRSRAPPGRTAALSSVRPRSPLSLDCRISLIGLFAHYDSQPTVCSSMPS